MGVNDLRKMRHERLTFLAMVRRRAQSGDVSEFGLPQSRPLTPLGSQDRLPMFDHEA